MEPELQRSALATKSYILVQEVVTFCNINLIREMTTRIWE
jgi:hypothetical protein